MTVKEVLSEIQMLVGRAISVEGTILFTPEGMCLIDPADEFKSDAVSRGILLKQPGLLRKLNWVTPPRWARSTVVVGVLVKSERPQFPAMLEKLSKVAHVVDGKEVREVDFRGIDALTPEELEDIYREFTDPNERRYVIEGISKAKRVW